MEQSRDEIKEARCNGDKEEVKKLVAFAREDLFNDGRDMTYALMGEHGLDHGEMPSFDNWSYTYLWLHEALKWFLAHMDEPLEPEYVI